MKVCGQDEDKVKVRLSSGTDLGRTQSCRVQGKTTGLEWQLSSSLCPVSSLLEPLERSWLLTERLEL